MRSKIAPVLATDTIRYSSVWEDLRILCDSLAVGPEDDVLSITSAGDNVLGLLLREPRSITAIDLNRAQTYVLELKIAAIRLLDYGGFTRLVGVAPGDALAAYEGARPGLSPAAREFWDANTDALTRGLIGDGRLEAYFGGFRKHVESLHEPETLATLVAMEGGAAQRAYFEERVATPSFERLFRWYFGREMMAAQGRDPAQFRYVSEGDVGGYFWQRFCYACTELPLRSNFYLQLFLCGHVLDLDTGPDYLRPASFSALRGLVDRVTLVTDEVERLVTSEPVGRYSKLNLSDLFEYMSSDDADALFAALAERVRPGGRITYWNLLVPRTSPPTLAARLRRRDDIARPLWEQDRSWFYRAFHMEEVLPS